MYRKGFGKECVKGVMRIVPGNQGIYKFYFSFIEQRTFKDQVDHG